MDRDATPSKPQPRSPILDEAMAFRRRSPAGKIVAILIAVAVLGGAGTFAWLKYSASVARGKRLKADLVVARTKGRDAEKRARETSATLASRETELAVLRTLEAEVGPTRLGTDAAAAIVPALRGALGDAGGEVASGSGRVTLRLGEDALFESGKADLSDGGTEVLARVGKALGAFPAIQIRVESHTGDRRPRDKRSFPSNWELSTARAASVVRYLQDEADLDGERLSAQGFSQYRRGAAGRARIELVVFPKDPPPAAVTAAPGATAATPGPRRPVRRAPPPRKASSGLGAL